MSTAGTDREGRLISTMLDVMLAGMCDPPRFRRGRDYARQGAVGEMSVSAGVATAVVQGSRARPYNVTIRTTLVTAPQDGSSRLSSLVPGRDDINFDCECPDWDVPCKHAVATMVRLSENIGADPALLVAWRGADRSSGSSRATVGSRIGAPAADALPEKRRFTPEERVALDAFVGAPFSFTRPKLTPTAARPSAWDEPWSNMLDDAIKVLAQQPGR